MLADIPSQENRDKAQAVYSAGNFMAMNQYVKDFLKLLDDIKASKTRHDIYSDWLTMTAAALYSWKNDKSTEEEYQNIARQYSQDELKKHSELLEITVNALEKNDQDFLGEVFTFGELTNERNAQFFTPYNISRMMAAMMVSQNEPRKGRVIRVNDPTCGAGGMLVAVCDVMKNVAGINYQQDVYFVGQDIDARCARMAYIQLSLLGAPALIICGNTLTMQTYWQRETIGYHISGIDFRLRAEALLDFMANIEAPKEEKIRSPPETINVPASKEFIQGELF